MEKKYTIGLDIGTNSVGWAVIDENFQLVQGKKKIKSNAVLSEKGITINGVKYEKGDILPDGKFYKTTSKTNLWGVRLFDEGNTAEERRQNRGQRRRIARRKERLNYLRGIFDEEIAKIDDSFFIRMDESFYHPEDKQQKHYTYRDKNGKRVKKEVANKVIFDYPLFKTEQEEKQYYKDFPTIYHLRYALMYPESAKGKFGFDENGKADIRLIYLAMHHILKYRGHFVQEGVNIQVSNVDILGNIKTFIADYNDYIDSKPIDEDGNLFKETEFRKNPDKINISDEQLNQIQDVLKEKISNSYKVYKIISKKNPDAILKYSINVEAIFKAIVGNKVDIASILNKAEYSKKTNEVWDKDANFKFSKETFEDDLQELPFDDDNESKLILSIKDIYVAVLLSSILQGENSLSSAMMMKYDTHKKDLEQLREVFNKYFNRADYEQFFREVPKLTSTGFFKVDEKGKATKTELTNYVAYVGLPKSYAKYNNKLEKPFNKYATQEQFYNYLTEKILLPKIIELTDFKVPKQEKIAKTVEFLEGQEDESLNLIQEILQKIELETFLVKQRMYKNGAIPYQVHEYELLEILKNQGKYYDFLNEKVETEIENEDGEISIQEQYKIQALMKFRIPYFVGPLSTEKNVGWVRDDISGKMQATGQKSKNSWLVRRTNEKLTPWNFNDVIDKDESAENFIVRMTSECTYLLGKKALPKNSLLYQKFTVLNELTKIKIGFDGEEGIFLDKIEKEKILRQLFYRKRTISRKEFETFLHNNLGYQTGIKVVRGIDGKGFNANLSTFYDLVDKVGLTPEFIEENEELLEEIIRAKTIFEDKPLRTKKIKELTKDSVLTAEQIKELSKKPLSGWGSLSAELINGVLSKEKTSTVSEETKTILDFLLDDEVYNIKKQRPQLANRNFMQLINDDTLTFKEQIAEHNADFMKATDSMERIEDKINALAGSPALKKGIKQTFKIVYELSKVLGKENVKNIVLEVAKDDNPKANNHSRYKQLGEFKKGFDASILKQYEELGKDEKEANKKLLNEKLFLYFIQNGKCLYSMEPLELDNLSSYEVDHIVPQRYIKDDSFSNKALVKSEWNQKKSGNYPFVDMIDDKVKEWWKSLRDQNANLKTPLFTKKKYESLTRTAPFSEFEEEGFINRQLVESRQIIKHVKNLLTEEFGFETITHKDGKKEKVKKTNILSMKASFTDGIRKVNNFHKSRELNDYHHAHDAYIIANVGQFLKNEINFGDERANIIRAKAQEKKSLMKTIEEKLSDAVENTKAKELKEKNSYLVRLFNSKAANLETGELLVDYMREVLGYKNCNIVRMYSEESGEFYNESIYKKDDKDDKGDSKKISDLISVKNGLDGQKYGGKSSVKPAYSVVVKYTTIEKKKEVSKIGVFSVMRIEKEKAKEDLLGFIQSKNPDWSDIEIVMPKILNNQIVITDTGIRRMFRSWNKSDGIVFNKGRQIILEKENYQTLVKFDEATNEEKLKLYQTLLGLLKQEEILSDKAFEGFEKLQEKFLSFPLKNVLEKTKVKEIGQKEVIQGMVSYLSAGKVGSKDTNLAKVDKALNNKILKIGNKSMKNYTILHQSITGLYETRTKLD
ncbi:CRISPR-associated endonuclease Csn1 [Pilibacter termitis]|uniref:CRISPR-associated endonuclease Cas9 n=1 Tax=Pilibacter termitis TaxID=263852 RepID=A0A1T4LEJ3_9ENTE|nr:type II CRISPR RNA-guided endonuclease Cas9 [Pilibacter termitis]SJZ53070.1 CRISPR-associated endonuclease Csn1 [Pilibacter termitis]